jgi:hypothetical protein
MSRKQATPSTSHINSLCKTNGHDWHETLTTTYRTCRREGCRAAERLVNGSWTNASAAPSSRKQQQSTPAITSETAMLWNTRWYDEQGWPPLDYDPLRERRAEQSYYKAVADEHADRARLQRLRERGATCR